ncbi:MAG: M23 family metallopeptidase [Kiritimatiellae bacterium]|nr:M23 family metallopeptidase [Kiritimatiellia bacterium]
MSARPWWLMTILAAVLLGAGLLGLLRLGGLRLNGWHSRVDLPPARVESMQTARPLVFVPPTPQSRLLETNSTSVYMPTASGRIESAWFGSTRTASSGRASFHEGIDIGPTARDRKGWALDEIFAATDGVVAHVNSVAGRSNYGKYVVLRHTCGSDTFYTLYAHLQETDVRTGQTVAAGSRIGRMGHTSSSPIPPARAHLHFEVALMLNPAFDRWHRAQKLKPDHGRFHGWNLLGLNPLLPYLAQAQERSFTLREALNQHPAAFRIAVRSARRPGYFQDVPSAWHGAEYAGPAWTADVSENGIPLRAWTSTSEELGLLGQSSIAVLSADDGVLGRNGRRLVVPERRGEWALGSTGRQWLDMLLYTP